SACLISPRNFMKTGAAAAGAAALTPEVLLAQRQRSQGPAKTLPAPIAALESMKSQAKPITREERVARIEKARTLMAKNKLAAIMITGGTSLVYSSNIQWWLSERLFALILPAKGEPFFVSPAFEEDRAREQISGEFSPFGGNSNLDVRT